MKKLLFTLIAAGVVALAATTISAQTEPKEKKAKKEGATMASNDATAPKTVIHFVTVRWKDGTTEEQIKAVLDGVKAMPAKYKGMTRVWTKTVKVQNQRGSEVGAKVTHAIAMEFADEAAFKAYTDSPAQLEWYKIYQPIRESSTTHDVTN